MTTGWRGFRTGGETGRRGDGVIVLGGGTDHKLAGELGFVVALTKQTCPMDTKTPEGPIRDTRAPHDSRCSVVQSHGTGVHVLPRDAKYSPNPTTTYL